MKCHVHRLLILPLLASVFVAGAPAQDISAPLLTVFTNPTPATDDRFGRAVAAVGNDRVLIGAYRDNTGGADAGAAYLLSTSGTLLTTFTNPTPAVDDWFGRSVAVLGSNRVIIGAVQDDTGAGDAGAVYLFSTNGTLLTTFTNPTPVAFDQFGTSVAALGNDRVLIGASVAGAAYLFRSNGALLTTFTNPTPAANDQFGGSVAALGNDRVLVGAYVDDTGAEDAGAAYLFRTNGTLLATFTNPTPAMFDYFGWSVAAVGSNRVLIGAREDDTGALNAGAAYLFNTNGALVTTFTNPAPAENDLFGYSVAAVGTNRVLISAHQNDTGATNAGVAYLFRTNGTLLAIFNNPAPADHDQFGIALAAVGNDRVLIGAFQSDTGATNTGTAYLFTFPFPPLNIARTNTNYSVSWITDETDLILQQADALGALATTWTNTPDAVSTNGLTNLMQQPVPGVLTSRFYRLRRP